MGDKIWYTDNHSKYGTYIKIDTVRFTPLRANCFYIGNTKITLEKKNVNNYSLTMSSGGLGLTKIINKVTMPRFFIGRGAQNQIQVDDDTASTHHAELNFNESQQCWEIRDHGRSGKGSSNKTWIDIGVPTIYVQPGTVLRIEEESFLIFR